jgi:hypothetical protein
MSTDLYICETEYWIPRWECHGCYYIADNRVERLQIFNLWDLCHCSTWAGNYDGSSGPSLVRAALHRMTLGVNNISWQSSSVFHVVYHVPTSQAFYKTVTLDAHTSTLCGCYPCMFLSQDCNATGIGSLWICDEHFSCCNCALETRLY